MSKIRPRNFLIVFSIALLSVASVVSSGAFQISYAEASTVFTIPCTIATYGNAWNGDLTFGLFQYSSFTVIASYLVVMNTSGEALYLQQYSDSLGGPDSGGYGVMKYVSNGTNTFLMYQGDPNQSTHFLNLNTGQTIDFPNVSGYHHDIDYDPITGNFLVLNNYVRNVNGTDVLYDKIVELNATGGVLWTWDSYDYLPLSWADPNNDTVAVGNETVVDFTHCNAIQWDYADNVVYLNSRHLDTFWKINMTTGDIIWGCGLHGNFTLLDESGNKVSSLWYGSHDLEEIAPDVFTMFDNDFHNLTNINDAHSSMLEITLNEQNMTAQETWSWEAPEQYYSPYWGEVDVLPNGDRIGTFGTQTKQYNSSIGAVIVEVNQTGQIVRTWTFPSGWGIYRAIPMDVSVGSPSSKSSSGAFNSEMVIAVAVVVAAALIICFVVLRTKRRSSAKASKTQ
jgi:hypothetical protein